MLVSYLRIELKKTMEHEGFYMLSIQSVLFSGIYAHDNFFYKFK